MKKKLITGAIITLLIIANLLLAAYFAKYKHGLFIDELWTFNLSNSYFLPFIGDASKYFNQWLDKDFFINALTVQPDNKFSYLSVIANQQADVHPPLYYFIFHTVSSFFPNTFSYWIGWSINFGFLALTLVSLYFLSYRLSRSTRLSLVTMILYGFSLGCMSNVLFIRMYMMLTFFVVLATLITVSIKPEKYDWKNLGLLFVAYVCGFLTQYYFLIYAFFLSGFYCLYLLLRKNYKFLLMYAGTGFASVLAALLIFPAALEHIIFGGYRGTEAVENLVLSDFGKQVYSFLTFLNSDIYFHIYVLGAVLILTWFVRTKCAFSLRKQGDSLNLNVQSRALYSVTLTDSFFKYAVLSGAALCTFLLIAKISAFQENRYIFFIYPTACVILAASAYNALIGLGIRKTAALLLILFVFAFYDATHLKHKNIKFFDIANTRTIALLESDPGSRLLYISADKMWWPTMAFSQLFASAPKTMFVLENDLSKVDFLKGNFIVVLNRFTNNSKIRKELEKSKLKLAPLFFDWHGNVFKVVPK